jgi:hypothetical protein
MFRRLLPLLILSQLGVLGFVVAMGFTVQQRWHGIYLLWGIGIGVLGAVNQQLSVHVLPTLAGATVEQTDRFRRRSTLRTRIVMVEVITLGIAAGALSSILDKMIVVLIYSIIVVLSGGFVPSDPVSGGADPQTAGRLTPLPQPGHSGLPRRAGMTGSESAESDRSRSLLARGIAGMGAWETLASIRPRVTAAPTG